MKHPRFRLRTLMISVAVVALGLTAILLVMERRERFTRISLRHSGVFPQTTFADLITGTELDRQQLFLGSKQVHAWHSEMDKKYRYAARYPWLPVAPGPPEPRRPVGSSAPLQ